MYILKLNNLSSKIIVFLLLILYICFLFMDFFNIRGVINVDYIKLSCTALCFLLSFSYSSHNKRSFLLLHLALLFTLISDFILLALNNNSLGVTTFCTAHILYSIRNDCNNYKKTLSFLSSVLMLLVFFYFISLFLNLKIEYLAFISAFYLTCLFTNLYKALKAYKKNLFPSPKGAFIAAGMLLFFLCDMNVAIYNLATSHTLHRISYVLIWFFYLPSQLLLSTSEQAAVTLKN